MLVGHSPEIPLGGDPSGPGLDKGRNDPHNLPEIPGLPSREARGKLNGSRLVVGELMVSASASDDGDDDDKVTSADMMLGIEESSEVVEETGDAPGARGEDRDAAGAACGGESAGASVAAGWASPMTLSVTAAKDQSVWYSVMPPNRSGSFTLMRLVWPGLPYMEGQEGSM